MIKIAILDRKTNNFIKYIDRDEVDFYERNNKYRVVAEIPKFYELREEMTKDL